MKMIMGAEFAVLKRESDGSYKTLKSKDFNNVCLGGFSFEINGITVPFDFDASYCNGTENGFYYQSGEGAFFNDFELTDCYEEDYQNIGLVKDDITPQFLASATKIIEFHINLVDKMNNECDIGWSEDNTATSDFRIKLFDITFSDMNSNEYSINKEVLSEFNKEEL